MPVPDGRIHTRCSWDDAAISTGLAPPGPAGCDLHPPVQPCGRRAWRRPCSRLTRRRRTSEPGRRHRRHGRSPSRRYPSSARSARNTAFRLVGPLVTQLCDDCLAPAAPRSDCRGSGPTTPTTTMPNSGRRPSASFRTRSRRAVAARPAPPSSGGPCPHPSPKIPPDQATHRQVDDARNRRRGTRRCRLPRGGTSWSWTKRGPDASDRHGPPGVFMK